MKVSSLKDRKGIFVISRNALNERWVGSDGFHHVGDFGTRIPDSIVSITIRTQFKMN